MAKETSTFKPELDFTFLSVLVGLIFFFIFVVWVISRYQGRKQTQ